MRWPKTVFRWSRCQKGILASPLQHRLALAAASEEEVLTSLGEVFRVPCSAEQPDSEDRLALVLSGLSGLVSRLALAFHPRGPTSRWIVFQPPFAYRVRIQLGVPFRVPCSGWVSSLPATTLRVLV